MKLKIIFSLLIMFVLYSCSTIESESVQPRNEIAKTGAKQYNKWITKKPFIVTQYYQNGEPVNPFGECASDNVLYFSSDSTFVELEGANKCGVSDTADVGTYELTDTTLRLITRNLGNQLFTIIEFKPNSFKVRPTSPLFPIGADFESVK